MNNLPVDELTIVDVYDKGIPNMERIVLHVNQGIDLGPYGLMIGLRAQSGTAIPIRDNLLWFGRGWVNRGDWIFVYTAQGEPKVHPLPNVEERLYTIHWGKAQTVFQNPELTPILFRMDAIQIPEKQIALPAAPHRFV